MTDEAVVDKVTIVADAARAAGRLDAIELHIRTFFVSVTDDRDQAFADMGELGCSIPTPSPRRRSRSSAASSRSPTT